VAHWAQIPAEEDIAEYYNLPPTATFRDVIKCVRADEACHRDCNHSFASMECDEFVAPHEIVFTEKLYRAAHGEHESLDKTQGFEENEKIVRTKEPQELKKAKNMNKVSDPAN
jgi:hypothetical protein